MRKSLGDLKNQQFTVMDVSTKESAVCFKAALPGMSRSSQKRLSSDGFSRFMMNFKIRSYDVLNLWGFGLFRQRIV